MRAGRGKGTVDRVRCASDAQLRAVRRVNCSVGGHWYIRVMRNRKCDIY
jgi:hypothetical protein